MPNITDLIRLKGKWLKAENLHLKGTKSSLLIDYENIIHCENIGDYIFIRETNQRIYFELRESNLNNEFQILDLFCPFSGRKVKQLLYDPFDKQFKSRQEVRGGYYETNRRSKFKRAFDKLLFGKKLSSSDYKQINDFLK